MTSECAFSMLATELQQKQLTLGKKHMVCTLNQTDKSFFCPQQFLSFAAHVTIVVASRPFLFDGMNRFSDKINLQETAQQSSESAAIILWICSIVSFLNYTDLC